MDVVMVVLYYSIPKVPGVVKFIEEKKAEWWLPGAEERRECRIILQQVQSFSLGRWKILEIALIGVQSLSHVHSLQSHGLQNPRLPCPSPSPSLLKLMSIESVMDEHLILCHPLLLLPSVFPSIRVFSSESALHITWAKYWSFSINPSKEYSELIAFRIDWLDLLAVQATLKSLQHYNSKASIFQCSAFFRVQLSHPYMTTGKTIALTIRTLVSKVISLLFNMLNKFAALINFLILSTFWNVCFYMIIFKILVKTENEIVGWHHRLNGHEFK